MREGQEQLNDLDLCHVAHALQSRSFTSASYGCATVEGLHGA